jgi:hypothetical protein
MLDRVAEEKKDPWHGSQRNDKYIEGSQRIDWCIVFVKPGATGVQRHW